MAGGLDQRYGSFFFNHLQGYRRIPKSLPDQITNVAAQHLVGLNVAHLFGGPIDHDHIAPVVGDKKTVFGMLHDGFEDQAIVFGGDSLVNVERGARHGIFVDSAAVFSDQPSLNMAPQPGTVNL